MGDLTASLVLQEVVSSSLGLVEKHPETEKEWGTGQVIWKGNEEWFFSKKIIVSPTLF